MEVDNESKLSPPHPSLAALLNDGQAEAWASAIVTLKNEVIGSNREKAQTVAHGLVPRLLQWLENETLGVDFRTEVAIILASLAKGGPGTVDLMVQQKTVPTLLKCLTNPNLSYTEAILRCLRSIFLCNTDAVDCLYEENRFGSSYIPHILGFLTCSVVCQECITTVLEKGCTTRDQQMYLLQSDALSYLAPLLSSNCYRVQMPTLHCLANMCYKNPAVCSTVAEESCLVEVIVRLMGRDRPSEMQLAAAKVLTYLHRAGTLSAADPIINRKTIGTLVRMCKRDRPLEENVKGAETLAYLIEVDPDLQVQASITDHLMATLQHYLHYTDVKKISSCDKKEVDWGSEMKRAALLAFASLSANDEEIRDKVIREVGMVDHILTSMGSSQKGEVAASLRCLQSLTRSVQQIRTVLHDNAVWNPLLQMLQTSDREIMVLAVTCLCNLVLDFSPSKQALIQHNALEILSEYCHSTDHTIRINAVWAVMSLSYLSSESLRERIVTTLGVDTLLMRLEDPIGLVRQKALGIVRNLFTAVKDCDERDTTGSSSSVPKMDKNSGDRTVIDRMVKLLGSEIVDCLFRTIQNQHLHPEVIEQALCAISNMADGPSCKSHIMGRTEDLQAVVLYLTSSPYVERDSMRCLQLPAIQFFTNLVESSDEGAYQRMLVLKNMGVHKVLEDMRSKFSDLEARILDCLKYFS
ncbi:Armadillo repeat-containing protein 8 [Plakobranchus ocellatus]|uniref:Armadillo repeat-containing protein 8 n=1 Tax=Plakobranchus ocellatus TaxID=259542 RepID=A0AAV3Z5T1_9GAST|nr:Armadillo repeat-containing protein 8 [Plakobranchus ocellatus]